jgi:TPP-dependent pyruvate/acetoin dehydrogenase alpha subunit
VEGARSHPRTLKWLQENGMITPDELGAIEAEVDAEIDEAVAFAENGTWEDVADLERFVLMDEVPE